MENTEPKPVQKVVKAKPSSPVYAVFDIVEIEGKQVVTASIGFVDQFGMERMAKTASEKGILNVGQQVLAIFAGQMDVIEPDEETKQKLAAQAIEDGKQQVLNAYDKKEEGK